MSDDSWYFNRLGKLAGQSNPGSATPNYGLTFDLSTAPWDSNAQFDSFVQSGTIPTYATQTPAPLPQQPTTAASAKAIAVAKAAGAVPSKEESGAHKTAWDHFMDAVHFGGRQLGGAVGAFDTLMHDKLGVDATSGNKYDKLSRQADKLGLTGWERDQFIGGADFGNSTKPLRTDPQLNYLTNKANEYGATVFVNATESQLKSGKGLGGVVTMFSGSQMGAAHKLVMSQHLNVGEAFTQMFYDDQILNEPKRLNQLRKHSTVFNASALAFNAVAGWELDPTVFAGKGLGALRGLARGDLAKAGASAEIQRTILGASSRDQAQKIARAATGLGNRVRAQHALSLFDRAQNLRETALAAKTGAVSKEWFLSRPAFQGSTNGTIMGQLMLEVADDPQEWNLLFRTALGDPTALEQLATRRGEIADKINAIQNHEAPTMQAELQRVQAEYDKRLAEQGRMGKKNAQIALVSDNDWLLHTRREDAMAQAEDLTNRFLSYKSSESFLDRATRGHDGSEQTGAIFNGLHSLSTGNGIMQGFGKALDGSLARMSGKVSTWKHDDYSPVVRWITMPRVPFLRRVGTVDLNEVDAGSDALTASLGQLAHVLGRDDQAMRDHILSSWASSTTDVSRQNLLGELHHQAFAAIGKKYGLEGETMKKFSSEVLKRRGQQWVNITDQTRWKMLALKNGQKANVLPFLDDTGALNLMHADVQDVTQLANHFPMVNWVDLDHTLRMNRDLFREVGLLRTAGIGARRWGNYIYNLVGSTFNSFWKPLALISFRWPMRVLGDEGFRTMLTVGAVPYVAGAGKALGRAAFGKGIVAPYELVGKRLIKTGAEDYEPLRTAYEDFDAYDPRRTTNPTGAVPAEAAEFGKADAQRHAEIVRRAQERTAQLENLEKPAWLQQWRDRLTEAEKSGRRGFFMDPVSHKANNKGYAVSVYPGRLRTFDHKPRAGELTYWTERNADVLSIPNNRVAVWHDKETGRWHLDVVRVHRTRDAAMMHAAKANANEFYDINDGFTRYMSNEDPYQHYSSPFVNPEPTAKDMPGGRVEDQRPLAQVSDRAGENLADAFNVEFGPRRKTTGTGKRVWKTADGKTAEGEAIYGIDPSSPNIHLATNSGQGMAQAMYGGYTKGLEVRRNFRSGTPSNFPVGEPGSHEAELWSKAWASFVNRHIRYSPVWKRMLHGASDGDLVRYLRSTEGRKMVVERLGHPVVNPHKYIQEMRATFDQFLPTEVSVLAARAGRVEAKQADQLVPHDLRSSFTADDIGNLDGGGQAGWYKAVSKIYEWLGSLPNDTFVRHPLANILYDMRMRNYIATLEGEHVSQGALNAAEAEARAFANKQIRRLLYNIADESQGTHMLRFIAPFAQAQYEVLNRYFRIFTDKPEALARTMFLFNKSQTQNAFWHTVDQNDKQTNKFSHDNNILIQVKPWMRGLVNQIPGLKHALDTQGKLAIPVSSIDLILQGDGANVFLPSLGPLATVPADEFYFKDHSWMLEKPIGKYVFPYGMPHGSNVLARAGEGMLPAYLRRIKSALFEDYSDSAFAATVVRNLDEQQFAYETGKRDTPPSLKEATDGAKALYYLRAIVSAGSPVPFQGHTIHQYYIDRYRDLKRKDPATADEKFYDTYGPEYMTFASDASKSLNGLAPTAGAGKAYGKYRDLMERAPDLAGVIAGPLAQKGPFNDGVYQWQLSTRLGPGRNQNMREFPDPQQQFADQQVSRGWVQYGKLQAAVDAELRARGLHSIMQTGAQDIYIKMQAAKRQIMQDNPAWQTAYDNQSTELPKWLNQADRVIWSPELDGRQDIMGLRQYLIARRKMQSILVQRQQSGLTTSASLYYDQNGNPSGQNEQQAREWQSYVGELVGRNPLFAEIYHRYLETDDLSALETFGG